MKNKKTWRFYYKFLEIPSDGQYISVQIKGLTAPGVIVNMTDDECITNIGPGKNVSNLIFIIA